MWTWGDRVKAISGTKNRWPIGHRFDALGYPSSRAHSLVNCQKLTTCTRQRCRRAQEQLLTASELIPPLVT
jgi:hypothetical protein